MSTVSKLKKADVLRMVKENGIADLLPLFESKSAEQTGDFSYDFLVDIGDGQEHWLNITATAKDVMVDDATGERVPYDPFVKQAQWQADKEEKAAAAAERKRKHDETVKRAEERKAKAREKALAKRKANSANAE